MCGTFITRAMPTRRKLRWSSWRESVFNVMPAEMRRQAPQWRAKLVDMCGAAQATRDMVDWRCGLGTTQAIKIDTSSHTPELDLGTSFMRSTCLILHTVCIAPDAVQHKEAITRPALDACNLKCLSGVYRKRYQRTNGMERINELAKIGAGWTNQCRLIPSCVLAPRRRHAEFD